MAGDAGFAVLVPERLGHGATGGKYVEDQGGCDEADYSRAGRATAASIESALSYLRGQSFVRQDGAVIVGHSAGGWGALALARENPQGVARIIAFAPRPDYTAVAAALAALVGSRIRQGRAGACDMAGGRQRQLFFAGVFQTAGRRLPHGRGQVDLHVLPASGSEGHWLAETEAGVKIAGSVLERALMLLHPTVVKKR